MHRVYECSDRYLNVKIHINYCTHCNWSMSTEWHDKSELATKSIEHYLNTDKSHGIDYMRYED